MPRSVLAVAIVIATALAVAMVNVGWRTWKVYDGVPPALKAASSGCNAALEALGVKPPLAAPTGRSSSDLIMRAEEKLREASQHDASYGPFHQELTAASSPSALHERQESIVNRCNEVYAEEARYFGITPSSLPPVTTTSPRGATPSPGAFPDGP